MVKSLKINNRKKNPYLSIAAPADSYTMDLMMVSSYEVQNEDKPLRSKRNKILHNVHSGGVEYILVIIETTSRKIFVYPLKNKKAATVHEAFKKFFEDAHHRVNNVTSDLGNEYQDIWKDDYFTNERCIRFYKVNTSENYHSPLAMVDRAIRTLRGLLSVYFSETGRYDFQNALPKIVELYNDTEHSSLYTYRAKGRKRYYYTPNEVWLSPVLMKIINQKDRLRGEKGKKFLEKNFELGKKYHYRIGGDEFSKGKKSGMVSNDEVTLIQRKGNSFYVKSDNPKLNKKLIPYRNLFPAKENRGKLTSKVYKMTEKGLVEVEAKMLPQMSVKQHRTIMALTDNNPDKLKSMILPGRTRSETRLYASKQNVKDKKKGKKKRDIGIDTKNILNSKLRPRRKKR